MANYFDKYDDMPTAKGPTTKGNYFDKYDEPAEPVAAPAAEEEGPGFLEKAKGHAQSAATGILDSYMGSPDFNSDALFQQELGVPMTGQRGTAGAIAETVGAASNILMDGGIELVQAILPDSWEDAVVNFSRATWEKANENPTFREGIQLAVKGGEAYSKWAKDNPEYAQAVADAVAVGSLGKTGKVNRGKRMQDEAAEAMVNNRKASARKTLEPAKGTGDGEYYESLKSRTVRYDPSPWEREVADELAKQKNYNPKRSSTYNMTVAREEATLARESLEAALDAGAKPIDTQKVRQGLINKVNNIDKHTLLTGEASEKAVRMYHYVDELLEASDGSAKGLLQVRRDLDQWVHSQKKVWDTDMENATKVALKDIRDHLNDKVAEAMPTKVVKDSLAKQSRLLRAGDILEGKMLKEADTAIGRLRQQMEATLHTKFPTTPLAAAATVGAGAAMAGPTGIGAGAGLFAAYKGARWLASPAGKKWLGRVVEVVDATNPDVQLLIQLSQELEPEEP